MQDASWSATVDTLTALCGTIGGYIWGPALLTLLVGTGLYLTIRLSGVQFRMLPYALKLAFSRNQDDKSAGDISQFQSLMTALAATIGTGNIAGVATAVVLGGPGAIFWMWLTALAGMATKYAEGLLAILYRVRDESGQMAGGPMYYIERGLNMKWLAMAFAFFGMIAALGTGCSVQSNSVAHAIESSFGISPWITGMILTLITALVMLGGIHSIARVAGVIVPGMALLYILGGLTIIFTNLELLIPALRLIFDDAFTGNAVAGGALGTVIRYGIARGLFSNEAGLGTAPIAAAAAKTDHASKQALVSMTGTFIDTIVVCSITGLALVMGGLYTSGLNGAALTSQTFNVLLPGPGGWIVTIGLIFFSYSTILGWSFYGEKCTQYLFGSGSIKVYRFIYISFVMLGTIVSLDLVWAVSDVFNGLMAIPNLIGIILLSGDVARETKQLFDKHS
ncbi:sodium:alanine symporter family protein [Orrella sp. NBD-18]|uniref:Sodium:alanine symporter family protein n=1 Tax=Sheuella amnicola TaxID=2707330 RepID=A0A6B2QXJ1_9BURK|nr:sodium:alanine symporter family protein [Sheuella amnicola]NDY82004.1 sodium:alanine symporter family protein [Sheuella amnicola]